MRTALATVLRRAGPPPGRAALAILLGFATAASGLFLTATSAWLVATAGLRPSLAVLSVAIVGVRFFGLSRALLRYVDRLFAHDLVLRGLARLRSWFFAGIEPLAPAGLEGHRSGDLASRVVGDVDVLEGVYVRVIGPIAVAAATGLFLLVLLWRPDGRIAGTVIAGLLAAGALAPLLALRMSRASGERLAATRGELQALVVDGVQGVSELLANGAGESHRARVERGSRGLASAQLAVARAGSFGGALSGLFADWTAVAALAVAIPLAASGRLEGVQLAVVALTALASFEVAGGLAAAWPHLGTAEGAAERLLEVMEPVPAPAAGHGGLTVTAFRDERGAEPSGFDLELSSLSFTYPGQPGPALHDLDLRLPEGAFVAVVGSSGSGKSTLASLLLRFREPDHGVTRLGGADVRGLDPDRVRGRFAFMGQKTDLFTGTLRDNLLLAHPGAGPHELEDALAFAGLTGFVSDLPEGLETSIGEQGVRLSGGERQRVALARAFLSAHPILLLDEPTAHLDAVTERRLLENLAGDRGERSLLLITHRIAGLERADEILVLESGRCAERGTHEALLRAGGIYGRLAARAAGLDPECGDPAAPFEDHHTTT